MTASQSTLIPLISNKAAFTECVNTFGITKQTARQIIKMVIQEENYDNYYVIEVLERNISDFHVVLQSVVKHACHKTGAIILNKYIVQYTQKKAIWDVRGKMYPIVGYIYDSSVVDLMEHADVRLKKLRSDEKILSGLRDEMAKIFNIDPEHEKRLKTEIEIAGQQRVGLNENWRALYDV